MKKDKPGKSDAVKDNSLNDGLTARPTTEDASDQTETAFDSATPGNLDDARELGYTDEDGNAREMARPDVEGSPTGAYTDIGAGRSSAVKPTYSRSQQ